MTKTVVPNRNTIMLAIAFGIASSIGAGRVGAAVHAGDHAIYPDCRPEFVGGFQAMQNIALEGLPTPLIYTPFVHLTKAQIAEIGDGLGVPWQDTWSCYEGGRIHCGKCGTCVERIEAFALAKVSDPTLYEDIEFASQVLK
jgi:7-cyano-7-deazaguanine synthase